MSNCFIQISGRNHRTILSKRNADQFRCVVPGTIKRKSRQSTSYPAGASFRLLKIMLEKVRLCKQTIIKSDDVKCLNNGSNDEKAQKKRPNPNPCFIPSMINFMYLLLPIIFTAVLTLL